MGNDELIQEESFKPSAKTSTDATCESALGNFGLDILLVSLKALSQRFVIALSQLFTLATVGSVCYLWLQVLPQPSEHQIASVGIYSAFVLLIHIIRGKS